MDDGYNAWDSIGSSARVNDIINNSLTCPRIVDHLWNISSIWPFVVVCTFVIVFIVTYGSITLSWPHTSDIWTACL